MRLERSEERHRERCRSPQARTANVTQERHQRSRSLSPSGLIRKDAEFDYRVDTNNRLHVNFPRTGSVHVFNRASKFHAATVKTHANDLFKVLTGDIKEKSKYAVSITCDNGPDWSHKSPLTQLYMGRIWRDHDLDYLVLVSYAPGHSAENMIEHAWAPLGRYLVGVTLSAKLPGEDLPPCRQSGLTQEEKKSKEARVLDSAIDQLNSVWSNRTFHGHPVTSAKIPCLENPASKTYDDYTTVKGFFEAGVRVRAENPAYRNIGMEYKFMMQHCIKSTYRLEFIKCQAPSCFHCRSHPVRAVSLLSLLRKFGSKLFSPTRSLTHPSSFETFLELAFSPLISERSELDEELPSLKSRGLNTRCHEPGCYYIIASEADAKRHKLLVHDSSTGLKKKQSKTTCIKAKKQKLKK